MRFGWIILIAAVMLSGCVTISSLNKLNMGMTRADVFKALGNPDSVQKYEIEVLEYQLKPHMLSQTADPHIVILKDGKVLFYGRKKDLDFSAYMQSDGQNSPLP